MKKVRMTGMIGIVFVICVLCVLAIWCIRSTGHIREYVNERGEKIPGSVSEKILVELNGAKNGLFINGKDSSNPVLLFVSSGPGTDDYFLNEKYSDMHLEDEYTMVYWDYRGMGIAYDPDTNLEMITADVLLEDTIAVTEYLKERFQQDKIYIMGFSGGSHIALRAVQECPENYYAYISMAQCVTDSADNDTYMYEFMKSVFEERNDRKSQKKLEEEVEHLEDGRVKCKDWYFYVYLLHKAGGGTTYNETETVGIGIPIMMAHCYTVSEKIHYIQGMKMYRKTAFVKELQDFDYRETVQELALPAYFISGEYDFNSPWPLVKEFCDNLSAVDKNFFLIHNAAHSPLWEQAADCHEIIIRIKENTYHG